VLGVLLVKEKELVALLVSVVGVMLLLLLCVAVLNDAMLVDVIVVVLLLPVGLVADALLVCVVLSKLVVVLLEEVANDVV